MLRQTLALAIALLGIAAPPLGQATMVSLEDGYEASTDSVSLPESVPARWTFRPCATCRTVDVQVDASSAFFVGKQQVSLALLRKYAERGSTRMDVYAEPRTRRVTRVILRTELDAADRPAVAAPAKR